MLRGARALLASRRARIVQFEVSPGLAPGGVAPYLAAVDLLRGAGYECYECACHDRPADPFMGYARTPLGTQCRFGMLKLLTPHAGAPELRSGEGVLLSARLAQLAARRFEVNGVNHGWWSEFMCVTNHSSHHTP